MAPNWYVLRSKPHKEDFLYTQLLARDIDAYCPKIRVQPVNPRARKSKPLFPGYLFVHVDFDQVTLSTLRWLPGAVGVVSFGKTPAWVPDPLVHSIRKKVEEINAAGGEHLVGLTAGDEVIVQSGPFAGYAGIFDLHLSGSERVRVLLQAIQNQKMPVELPLSQIKKR